MGKIQKALDKQLRKMPELALTKLLEQKLEAIGAKLPPEGIVAFARHLLAGNSENFTWNDGSDSDQTTLHSLAFDEADVAEIDRMVKRLTNELPELIAKISKKSGRDLFKTLRANWEIEGAVQAYETGEFCERLEERWGESLDLLRMLLTVCREYGREAHERYRRSKSKKHKFRRFVLVRLHSRACQVADEIITLMANGFADGAMARWRTLHEIAVVTTIIEDGDEELAERYILHDAVDLKREADEYNRSQVPLGYAPLDPVILKDVEWNYTAALARFGDGFRGEYGWAEPLIKGRITFRRLQEEAGRAGMTSYYKLASYNVHAGARSMFHRLSDMRSDNNLLAGRSNAGMVEPGQNLAFTLVQITSSLTPKAKDIDNIIEQAAVIEIRNAIPKVLAKADRRLRKDDAEFHKTLSNKGKEATSKRLRRSR